MTRKNKIRIGLHALVAVMVPGLLMAAQPAKEKPADPFDYNFCGGERVYPIVGAEFATMCGPRNMVALGRRGKLMWFFPDMINEGARQGAIRLSDAQLLELSLLAEVVQVAPPAQPVALPVQYKLGVNFSGRPYQRVHTGLDERYLPSHKLFRRMLSLVPDQPLLPDCGAGPVVFDPILTRVERQRLYANSLSAKAE